MAKDNWEKVDVVSKFISSVALAVVAVFLKLGADKLATSQRDGELVSKMISDLASPDTSIRKDLAILALNHAIPRPDDDESSDLVADLSVRVLRTALRDSLAARGYDATELFHILKNRAPHRAASLQAEFRAALRESGAKSRGAAAGDLVRHSIEAVLGHVVYLQFEGSEGWRKDVDAAMGALRQAGFNAPGVEHVQGGADNTVRFFRDADRPLADSVAAVLARIPSLSHPTVGRAPYTGPPRQIEVWLKFPPSAPPPPPSP